MKSRPARTSTALSPAGIAPGLPVTVEMPLTGIVIEISSGWICEFAGGAACVVKYETTVRPSGAPAVLRIEGCTETAKREPEASGADGVKVTLLPTESIEPPTALFVVTLLTRMPRAMELWSIGALNVAVTTCAAGATSAPSTGVTPVSCSGCGVSTRSPNGTKAFGAGLDAATTTWPSPNATVCGRSENGDAGG